MKHLELFEAFALGKAKEITKQWKDEGGESRYDELFGKNVYRIYLPITISPADIAEIAAVRSDTMTKAENLLQREGYVFIDYQAGTCTKIADDRNIFKIGKLLQRFDPELKQDFDADITRVGAQMLKGNMSVCISRHAYDIAGMSTGRGWTSCMNLHDGSRANRVVDDVMEGSIIAYLIKANDKNLQSPISRLLLKPFNQQLRDGGTRTILYPDHRMYGTDVPSFFETVKAWSATINGKAVGKFTINRHVYNDNHMDNMELVPDGYEVDKLVSDDLIIVRRIEDQQYQLLDHEGNALWGGQAYNGIELLQQHGGVYFQVLDRISGTTLRNLDGEILYTAENGSLISGFGCDYFYVVGRDRNDGKMIDKDGVVLMEDINKQRRLENYIALYQGSKLFLFDKRTGEIITCPDDPEQKVLVRELAGFIWLTGSNLYRIVEHKLQFVMKLSGMKANDNYKHDIYRFRDTDDNCYLAKDGLLHKLIHDSDTSTYEFFRAVEIRDKKQTDTIVVYNHRNEDVSFPTLRFYSVNKQKFIFENVQAKDYENFLDGDVRTPIWRLDTFLKKGLYNMLTEEVLLDQEYTSIRRADAVFGFRAKKGRVYYTFHAYGDSNLGYIDDTGKIEIRNS